MCVYILIYTGRQGLFYVGLPKHCRGWRGSWAMGNAPWTHVVVQILCCYKGRKTLKN